MQRRLMLLYSTNHLLRKVGNTLAGFHNLGHKVKEHTQAVFVAIGRIV